MTGGNDWPVCPYFPHVIISIFQFLPSHYLLVIWRIFVNPIRKQDSSVAEFTHTQGRHMKKTLLSISLGLIAILMFSGELWGDPPDEVFDARFETGSLEEWSSSESGPKVRWQPERIEKTILINDRRPLRLMLKFQVDLPETVLVPTPGLADQIVSINPSQLPAAPSGTVVTVDLVLTQNKLEESGGTIHLRQANGPPRTFAKPLPILVIGTADVQETLPPPEPEGQFEFTDSDADGVPDNAQRAIELNGDLSRPQKEVLLENARITALKFNEETWDQAYALWMDNRRCTYSVFRAGKGEGTFLEARYPMLMALFGDPDGTTHHSRVQVFLDYQDNLYDIDERYWNERDIPTWTPAPPCLLPLDELED